MSGALKGDRDGGVAGSGGTGGSSGGGNGGAAGTGGGGGATASGGADASMGGMQSTGGVSDATGGVSNSTGGVTNSTGGADASVGGAGGAEAGVGGSGGSAGDSGCTSCTGPLRVDEGCFHSCGLRNGKVKCWGQNYRGILGVGDELDRGDQLGEMGTNLPFIDLGTGRQATTLSVGGSHACAILDNRQLKCWGANDTWGLLGLGDTAFRGDSPSDMGDALPPVDLGAGRSAAFISAGGSFSCAILDDARTKCWGRNSVGQLGLGDTVTRGIGPGEMGDNLPPLDFGSGRTAVAVSVGGFHACALLDDKHVKCWGYNVGGQLGLGDTANRGDVPGEMGDALPAVNLGSGRTAKAISAGMQHTCAILDNDKVKCWGQNIDGELGLGDANIHGRSPSEMGDNLPFVDLGAGRTVLSIAAGITHTCAILDDHKVKCWGTNGSGELGVGNTTYLGTLPSHMGDNLPYASLGTGRTAVSVSTPTCGANSSGHTCAVLDDGSVKCWGLNALGQLGLGDTVNRGGSASQMGDSLPVVDLGL